MMEQIEVAARPFCSPPRSRFSVATLWHTAEIAPLAFVFTFAIALAHANPSMFPRRRPRSSKDQDDAAVMPHESVDEK